MDEFKPEDEGWGEIQRSSYWSFSSDLLNVLGVLNVANRRSI